MMEFGNIAAWVIAAIALVGLIYSRIEAAASRAREQTTRFDLEGQLKQLRIEREKVADEIKLEIKVAQKRADDAHSAIVKVELDQMGFRERLGREMLRSEMLTGVEARINGNVEAVEHRLTAAFQALSDRVDLFAKAVIDERRAQK